MSWAFTAEYQGIYDHDGRGCGGCGSGGDMGNLCV